MSLFKLDELLDAPCIFCNYNGQGYYQAHTHKVWCPFYEIGGDIERENAIVVFARKGRLHIDMGEKAKSANEQAVEDKKTINIYKCEHMAEDEHFCTHIGDVVQ